MYSYYYDNIVKPTLLRSFKKSFSGQNFLNQEVNQAIGKQQDSIHMLQYMRTSALVTNKEYAHLVLPMVAMIPKITSQVKNYTKDGSRVEAVTKMFNDLVQRIKEREEGSETAVPVLSAKEVTIIVQERVSEEAVRNAKANRGNTKVEVAGVKGIEGV